MFQGWCEAGGSPDGFWHRTPRQIALVFKAAGTRAGRDNEARFYAAWLTARLMTTAYHAPRDFPAWDKVKPRSRGVQNARSADEIMAIARMWNSALGGVVETR